MPTAIQSYSLVITRAAWEFALRPLSLNPDQFATGSFRWNRGGDPSELLVDRLEVTSQPPSGNQRPPLDDGVVFKVRAEGETVSARQWMETLEPQPSHVLAVLVVDGPRWDGAVWDRGVVRPLAGFRVVGSGMLEVGRDFPSEPWDELTRTRWSRTLPVVGERVFRKLRQSTVTLVGAGRNGSLMAFQLASLGVGRLRIIDGDLLNWENLDAMPGLTVEDVGQSKASALGKRLLAYRPDLSVTCLEQPLPDATAVELLRRRSVLIVTCVDSDVPRLAANLVARETLTVHLDVGSSIQVEAGGTPSFAGDVRLLVPNPTGGCVACVGRMDDLEHTLYELAAPPGSLRRGVPATWREQRLGSLLSLNSLAVGSGVLMWLDLLSGELRASHWQRLRWLPGAGLETQSGSVGSDDMCRLCQKH